jgi:hypothetical protein
LGLALAPLLGHAAIAQTVTDLTWPDLIPPGNSTLPPELRGLVAHEAAALASPLPQSSAVRSDWNGRMVRLPGYVIPLDYAGTGVTTFMLVPYVGACIHVPPPPANQLVLVTTERPFESTGLFEAVTVTGTFATASAATELADVGYAIAAQSIAPYP